MAVSTAPAETPQVGDAVQLVTVPSHVRNVPAGSVGVVLASGLPFGAVSVSFDRVPDPEDRKPRKYFMIRAAHLRRLDSAPAVPASTAGRGGPQTAGAARGPSPRPLDLAASRPEFRGMAAQPAGVASAPAGAAGGRR